MVVFSLQEQLDASSEDVLEFLQVAARSIHPSPLEGGRTLCFLGEVSGNTISIQVHACEIDQPAREVIRFEIFPRGGSLSVVMASCQSDNSHIVLIFHRIWASLSIAFGARFAGRALRRLRELESQA